MNVPENSEYGKYLTPESGAMIPLGVLGRARMSGSVPYGGPKPYVQPADIWTNRARRYAAEAAAGVNNQLRGMTATAGQESQMTQQMQLLDPAIAEEARRRREWRIAPPQKKRDMIAQKVLEIESGIAADKLKNATWQDMQRSSSIGMDSSVPSMDSFGYSKDHYTPEAILMRRKAEREADAQVAEMLSTFDKTSWDSPQAAIEAISQLPAFQKYGDLLGAYKYNLVRKFATPQMLAQMEAEKKNKQLFAAWLATPKGQEEFNQVAGEEFDNFRGTDYADVAESIYNNRNNSAAARNLYQSFVESSPVIYTEANGRVVPDRARELAYVEKRIREEEKRKAEAAKEAKKAELDDKIKAAKETIAIVERARPEAKGRLEVNEATGEIIDTKQYEEKPAALPSWEDNVNKFIQAERLSQYINNNNAILQYANMDKDTFEKQYNAAVERYNSSRPASPEQRDAFTQMQIIRDMWTAVHNPDGSVNESAVRDIMRRNEELKAILKQMGY